MYSHEKEIAKANPKWAFEYVSKHGKDEDLESIIAKDAYYSYQYAIDILEGPFNLGEPAIAKNPYYSFNYAKHILKGEFPLGEPEIAKDAYYSKEYTNVVLKKDFYLDGKLICKYEG
jgi:hypothetical protein